MTKNYIFHSTCFDNEDLRRKMIVLTDHSIDYKVVEKYSKIQFRAPLSGYFEVEIHISEHDFEQADQLMKQVFE
ncbi:MAG: hypothetical protein WAO52_00575 [Prolixibacteraceae bacterium]